MIWSSQFEGEKIKSGVSVFVGRGLGGGVEESGIVRENYKYPNKQG